MIQSSLLGGMVAHESILLRRYEWEIPGTTNSLKDLITAIWARNHSVLFRVIVPSSGREEFTRRAEDIDPVKMEKSKQNSGQAKLV